MIQGHINQFANDYSFKAKIEKYPHFNIAETFGNLFGPQVAGATGRILGSLTGGVVGQNLQSYGGTYGGSLAEQQRPTTEYTPEQRAQIQQANQQRFGQPQQGVSGGNQVGNNQQSLGQLPQESAPGYNEPNFDELITPVLEGLAQSENAARAFFETQVGEIEKGAKRRVETAETQRSEQQAKLTRTQTREEQRGESAIGEARRGFTELSKGLAARYGTGISTGVGATAILGRESMRAIGQIRTNLQESVNDINLTRQAVEDQSNRAIRESEADAQSLKQQAGAQLQQSLAEIATRRGELQTKRMELILQARQNDQTSVANINARNVAFQQKVYLAQQDAQNKLKLAIERVQSNVNDIDAKLFNTSRGVEAYKVQGGNVTQIPIQRATGAGSVLQGEDELDEILNQIQ